MTRRVAAMAVATAALLSGCGEVSPPPKDFATEDAVLAMRVEKGDEDSSYLVLVAPDGRTQALELEGVEGAGLSWTEHGITASDPTHDYLINDKGLTDHTRTNSGKSLKADREWFRVQVGSGTLVGLSDAESTSGERIVTYIDGRSGKATSRVSPSDTTAAAVCGERVFSPGRRTDTKAFEEDAGSIPKDEFDRAALTSVHPYDGADVLSSLEATLEAGTTSPCVDGIVYDAWHDGDADKDFVRTWNTTKRTQPGQAAADHQITYPEDDDSYHDRPSALTVAGGRLVWIDGNMMWSAPLPAGAAAPIQAREVGGVDGNIGLDAEVLAYSSNAAYTVSDGSDFHKRVSKGSDRVWTELTEVSLLRTDLATGKRSVALEVDVKDVDFPTKDVSVTALAVNPKWLAKNGG